MLSFVGAKPIGGALTLFELANGLRRLEHDVSLIHYWVDRGAEPPIRRVEDIGYASFEPGIDHAFVVPLEPFEWPDADLYCPPFWPPGARGGQPGLPFDIRQGFGMVHSKARETRELRFPCPKVVVAKWLVELLGGLGIPDHQVVYVPNGLDHDRFKVVAPVENRPFQISMLYRDHPQKGGANGLTVLAEVKRRNPGIRTVVFTPWLPTKPIPDGIEVVVDPEPRRLVEDIYNGSRVFLCPSISEGFGRMCVEAMACGAALVTTRNGGSMDYAIDGETALLCEPRDVQAMIDLVEKLLSDDELRVGLARRGVEYSKRFDWDKSSKTLADFLKTYQREPAHYQGPAPD